MSKWNFYTTNEIKPSGWLKRQLRIQAEGLSGNLDKMWPDIKDSAWIGGNREGWERMPYWLDGFIPLAYLLEDEDMISRAKKYIDAILNAQQSDGWICPGADDERKTYDTWALLLITKVLTLYYGCSKDERVPDAIYKALKNYYELLKSGQIELFFWGKFRWFEGLIAIEFLYERCKEDWLLELAEILKTQGANYAEFVDLWKRPLNRWRLDTHIVNIAMMLKAEALYNNLVGTTDLTATNYLFDILKNYNGTPVETFTGDECLSGLSPIQGTELCAVVEQMYSYECLYAYTGDTSWAERLEVIAFNALPATISDDMWTHQYVQMSNQIACERFPAKSIFRTNGPESHLFGLEPNYGCCTANFNQGWPKFALSAFMHRDNIVQNVIMIPSELNTDGINIKLDTNYPFENKFHYHVCAGKDFTFEIRIPAFAENLTVNGKQVVGPILSFDIKNGCQMDLDIDFETRPHLDARPNNLHTVRYGSLIFSVPIQYEKKMYEYASEGVERKYPYCDYELLPLSDWNYAYVGDRFAVHNNTVDDIPFSSVNPPVTIKAHVQKINWGLADGYERVCAKIPESVEPISAEEEIDLYPYGCAKLRMTEMPVIK